VILDGDLVRRLKACAAIERRKVEEVIAQVLHEYFRAEEAQGVTHIFLAEPAR